MPRSRGAFNTTMSVYAQANGIPALVPYATDIPCRFVVQDQITPVEPPFVDREAWVTYDGTAIQPPLVDIFDFTVTIHYGDADRIEVASHPGILWCQLLTEVVTPEGEPTYLRTWLVPQWW